MRIQKEIIKNYKYRLESDFSYDTLDFCRGMQQKHGSKEVGHFDGHWRIANPLLIQEFVDKFPHIVVDSNIAFDIESARVEKYREELNALEAQRIKNATTSTLEVKGLKQELYPHQKVSIEFFVNNNGRGILASVPGVGKTASALGYVVHARKQKTIVVCPASVKYSWESEVKKWTRLKPIVIDGKTKIDIVLIEDNDIIIMNYDILKKHFNALKNMRIDCIIFDEFHMIKNPSSQRAKFSKLISLKIPSVLLLSGTPFLNRPVELFTGLNIIDPVTWNDYYRYGARYCAGKVGHWGWEAKGATNIPELKEKISKYFLRHTKEEVLKDLPPKQYIEIPLELSPAFKKTYKLAERSFKEYLTQVKKKEASDNKLILLAKLSELRQITTASKIEAAKELIDQIIEAGEKIVVFSVYNTPLEHLKKLYGEQAVLIYGKTPQLQRRDNIERFQKDDSVQVFLGGLQSAGSGITLTAASNVLFLDYSWVPAEHKQGEDRIHRPGQEARSVSIYQLYTMNTVDDKMRAILAGKQKIFNKLIETNDEVEIVNELIKTL